jgi:methionyl-tRNA formyltransferase
MGTPDFAVPSLSAVAASCEVVLVVTQPDRPRGRGRASGPSAIADAAFTLGLPVLKADDMAARATVATLAALEADLFAVVAFGAILTPELLRVPRLGCINLHGSLLPDYRGASPVQRALWDGRAWSGVTTLWMDEGIDTGDLLLQRWAAIEPADDAACLAARLAALGGPLLAESLALAAAGIAPRIPQDRAAGPYARKLTKGVGSVDWALDAAVVWNRQRAVTPWPGAATGFGSRRLQLLRCRPFDLLATEAPAGRVLGIGPDGVRVACGRGSLLLERVKPEARGEMDAAEWARGARIQVGDQMDIIVEKEAHA